MNIQPRNMIPGHYYRVYDLWANEVLIVKFKHRTGMYHYMVECLMGNIPPIYNLVCFAENEVQILEEVDESLIVLEVLENEI